MFCRSQEKQLEQTVYESYKQRNEVEIMFDSYKNYLDADVSYMQNRYVLEGWLFANFIAMIAYYKLYVRLRQANLLSKYSPKDIIELSKAISELLLCRERAWNSYHASTVNFMGAWPPVTALQEEVTNRCMLLLRKRISSERYIKKAV